MKPKGFTLVELLIVLAILSVTMAIIIPSFRMVPSSQISVAAKDTLRIMRYARNMALQTQRPITLTFAHGCITLSSKDEQGDSLDSKSIIATREQKGSTLLASSETLSKPKTLTAGDIDTVSLSKNYNLVAFSFLGFEDTIQQNHSISSRSSTFSFRQERPNSIENDREISSSNAPFNEDQPFYIIVRANGTTRPFSIRLHERETTSAGGTIISFDFLCSGTIAQD